MIDKNMLFIVIFLCLFLIVLSHYIIYKTNLIFQNTEAELEDEDYDTMQKQKKDLEAENKQIDENLDHLMDDMNSIK